MRRFYILFLSCFFIYPLVAQNSYKLSVNELFQRGMDNSIAILASMTEVQVAEDRVNVAETKRLPDVEVGGLMGYVGTPVILDTDLSVVKHVDMPDWKQNYQINAQQLLYDGGRVGNNIKKAELEKEVARLSLQRNKGELKLWLMSKYLDLFNFYKSREVYAKNIEEATKRLRDIERMKAEGMITSNDVLRSKLVLTNYELFYKETTNNIAIVSQQLDVVLGLDETLILEPDETLLEFSADMMMESDYVTEAYNKYPGIKMVETNIHLAENNLKLAKADYFPTLSLQAGNSLGRPITSVSPVLDLFMNTWGISLNLSYNLSSVFKNRKTTSVAKHQIFLQELALEREKQNIRTEIKSAYIKHLEAEDRIKTLKESVAESEENYRITKNKYYNQLAILTDLLDADAVQLSAELRLTTAKTSAIYTYYQLQKAIGNL